MAAHEITVRGRRFVTIGEFARMHRIGRYRAIKTYAENPDAFDTAIHCYLPADAEPADARAYRRRG